MLTSLRVIVLAALLCVSQGAASVSYLWALSNVQFEDGAAAQGQFSYDSATGEVSSFNLRVTDGPNYLSFTYLPGNALAYQSAAGDPQPGIVFRSPNGGGALPRDFRITPATALDGSLSTVSIDLATHAGGSGSIECYNCAFARRIVSGSLLKVLLPPPVALVQVDEFYNAVRDHYFMTASDAEKMALDTGVFPGWVRTGQSFKAYAAGSSAGGSINPVCRYYGSPAAGLDSHFYSGSAQECFLVHAVFPTQWIYESDNVFQIALPDTSSGACPMGTIPVYRVWNHRVDSNHRYTTSTAIRDSMLALGYVAEGYGPMAVIMCAVA
jgi:hypothetical protein